MAQRTHERPIVGVFHPGDIDTATVPSGQKWVIRNITLTNFGVSSSSHFKLSIVVASVAFGLWTDEIPATQSKQPPLLTVLYPGDGFRIENSGSSGDFYVAVNVVKYQPI